MPCNRCHACKLHSQRMWPRLSPEANPNVAGFRLSYRCRVAACCNARKGCRHGSLQCTCCSCGHVGTPQPTLQAPWHPNQLYRPLGTYHPPVTAAPLLVRHDGNDHNHASHYLCIACTRKQIVVLWIVLVIHTRPYPSIPI